MPRGVLLCSAEGARQQIVPLQPLVTLVSYSTDCDPFGYDLRCEFVVHNCTTWIRRQNAPPRTARGKLCRSAPVAAPSALSAHIIAPGAQCSAALPMAGLLGTCPRASARRGRLFMSQYKYSLWNGENGITIVRDTHSRTNLHRRTTGTQRRPRVHSDSS